MRKIFVLGLILSVLASICAPLDNRVKPKLVVNIVVGQMRYDYLLRYANNLSENGFKILIKEGTACDRASYNFLGTSSPSGLATIASGSNPSTHGIIGTQWFNYTTAERMELLKDKTIKTIGADDYDNQVSPKSMYASTLGDQLKAISPFSKVVSVAFDAESAVLMGGHNADAAYWVNHRKGDFVTNSYYMATLPEWVVKYNDLKLAENYSNQQWRVCRNASDFQNIFRQDISVDTASNFFSFDWVSRKKWDFERLKSSPFANTMVKDFAVQAIIYEGLGKDGNTDLLNVVFDGSRHVGEKYGTQSMEAEDCFYRLDNEIGALLDYLKAQFKKEDILVVVTSDHGASDMIRETSKNPSGLFNPEQFAILINGFVGAQLGGDKRWVLDFINNQIYLDRRLIYQSGKDLEDLQTKIAAFAIQFRGVSQAITSSALTKSQYSNGIMGKAQNSFFPRHSGDVVLSLLPGWIVDDGKMSNCGTSYNYDTHVPLIFWGAMVGTVDVSEEVDMTDVAPTIAHIMGIAPPNASTGKPIMQIYSK